MFDCIWSDKPPNVVLESTWLKGLMILPRHYVIKFVSDLRQVAGGTQVSSTNKSDCHDITEILKHYKPTSNLLPQNIQVIWDQ